MSHHPVALTPPIAGRTAAKFYAGFGILGADIPSVGDNGGSPILNDGINPASEYHWRIVTAPAAGILTIYRDLSCDYDSNGVENGDYTAIYELFEGRSSVGTAPIDLHVGPFFIAGADSQQSNQAAAVAIKQTHQVGIADSQLINQASPGSVSQSSTTFISAANSAQINQADSAAIRQIHLLGVANSQQANNGAAGSASQSTTSFVSATDSAQINQGDVAAIRQTHLVGIASSQQANKASAGWVSDGSQPIGPATADLIVSARQATRLGVTHTTVTTLLREIDLSNVYFKGGAVRLQVRVAGDGDADFDPASLTLKFRFDAGPVTLMTYGTDPQIVRDRIGRFHADIDLAASGTFHYRWEASAPNGSAEGKIPVAAGRFS